MTDRHLVYLAAFLRALATGLIGVLIGIDLARRGFDAGDIGLVVGLGLAGAALAALVVTVLGDRLGRRRLLVAIAILGGAGGIAVALGDRLDVIAAAAFVGMLNGMGRDRGAAVILDHGILPATASDADRTHVFAWYNVLKDSGHALGGLVAGVPALLHVGGADRVALFVYAALLFATAGCYLRLSPAAELHLRGVRAPVTAASRRVVLRISALFAIDSIAGGFLTAALLTYFFFERFGASELAVGALFFGARVANAGSNLAAAWLAKRIGLVNTMVFTHLPSSLILIAVAFAPSFAIAASLFLLREMLVEMDVPTRESYVMAVVAPEERMFAAGVTHLVRVGGWAIAPAFAGLLMGRRSLAMPLVIGAAMKVVYDILLYAAFRRHRPPEEVTSRT